MIFECTSLSSIINIPEDCTDYFSCYGCINVTGFTGSANGMNFAMTSLSGIINIPKDCTELFSCCDCIGVTDMINNHDVFIYQW